MRKELLVSSWITHCTSGCSPVPPSKERGGKDKVKGADHPPAAGTVQRWLQATGRADPSSEVHSYEFMGPVPAGFHPIDKS